MAPSDFADVLARILPFTEEDDQILLEPYNYLAQSPGKNVRSQMVEAFNLWLKVDKDELRVINKVVGMLHTSSLLMDDVEDSSVLRRGAPVAHLIYGVPQTINTANYVYFLAYQELLKLRPTPTPPSSSSALTGEAASTAITPPLSPSMSRNSSIERRSESGGAEGRGEGKGGKSKLVHRLSYKLGLKKDAAAAPNVVDPTRVQPSMDGTGPSSTTPSEGGLSTSGTQTPPLATGLSGVGAGSTASVAGGGRKDEMLDRIVTEEMLALHRGQGLELFWRDSLTCPTEEEYVKMVLGKTGGLFRIAIKLMMAKSSCDVDFVPLVNLISIFFQIRDDYMNMQSTEYAENKNFAEDLTEGKFSFPIIHAIREKPSSRIVINTLQKKPTDQVMLHHCVDFMRSSTRSFEYTKEVLETLGKAVRTELARVGGLMELEKGEKSNRMLEKILEKLEAIP